MTPEETVKPKRTRKPKEEHLCHVHDDIKFLHDIDDIHQKVCVSKTEYDITEFEGKHYCLFHLPTIKDVNKFREIFINRLKKIDNVAKEIESEFYDDKIKQLEDKRKKHVRYDFRYVWFPIVVNLTNQKFKAPVDFSSATFTKYTYFSSATFTNYVDFSWTTFEEKSEIFFIKTNFNKPIYFNYTNFNGFVSFEGIKSNFVFIGEDSLLDLQNARIDDAKKISFHTVRLEPNWFVNVNASEFVFTDCKWRYADGKKLKVKQEIENLLQREASHNPHEILTKACWQLADNHEESKSLSKASMFRKFASESKRLATPWYLQPFTLHWWYYAVSYYGESWRRALFVLVIVLGGFGLLFESPFASFELPEKNKTEVIAKQTTDKLEQTKIYKMNYGEGFTYSLSVATFQRPEPKANDVLTKLFIVLEVIFAPLQAALLALAIRRKFMR